MADKEPVELEAEVIDGGALAAPDSERALALDIDAIRNDIAAMNEQVEGVAGMVETYWIEDEVLASLDMREVKAHATSLNKYCEKYEDARKSLKRHLTEPYRQIEDAGKQLMAPVVELRDMYKAEKDGRESREKAQRREGLERAYLEFAEANGLEKIVDVVPFERLMEPQWLNKTYGADKAASELEDKMAGIASEWRSLGKLDLAYFDEAEAEFFRSLSLQAAIDYNDARVAEQERIDALKADVAANRGEAEPDAACDAPGDDGEPQGDIVEQAERYVASVCHEDSAVYVLALEMTECGKDRLKGYMIANDIHGKLAKSGFANAETAMECMKGVIANG